MSVQSPPTASTAQDEQHGYARVRGRWVLLARGAWVFLIAVTLANFFASLPLYIAQLRTPCAGADCGYQQLTPGQIEVLHGMGLSLGGYVTLTVGLLLAGLAVSWVVSALIIWRRSDDRMAVLVALLLVTFGPLGASTALPAGPAPWKLPYTYANVLATALFVLVFVLFPSGRFVPRWMRWVYVVLLVGQAPGFLISTVPVLPSTSANQLGWLVALGAMATVVVVQLYRYRYVSSPLECQQTKWVMFGLAVPIAALVGLTVLALGFPAIAESSAAYVLAFNEVEFLLLLLLPLSFGFAVLRSRLWEIDTLINRTLVYSTLTVLLAAIYAALVIGLQALLRGLISQDSTAVIVISTLVVAAIFQPLRRRIQRVIDWRFYRRKYDVTKTVAVFGSTLHHEMDLDQLGEQLLTVVQETMQPIRLSLWIRPLDQQASEEGIKERALSVGDRRPIGAGASLLDTVPAGHA